MRKRPKLFYFTTFFCLCSLTAFISYFLLVRDVEQNLTVISGSGSRISKEINDRLIALEAGLRENRNLLDNVRARVDQVSKSVYIDRGSGTSGVSNQCLLYSAKTDINMNDAYNEIKFENNDGGAWKQGWNVELNETRLKNKLQVFVIPHSHNDPGWLKTFDQYYRDQTRHILDGMLKKLPENPNMKFIWAEISYFSSWWSSLSKESDKDEVRRLLANGQLEIVTGGWVMNDEASAHYFSIINQLTEGHEWLQMNLQYSPKSGWAIDPFGHSPSMAFLLKKMGLENMLIQRVHYEVKKYLAENQLLEFNWRMQHEVYPEKDMFCHSMPFYSYDIPHTCGPDPKVCCQFDFKRMPPYRLTCPWKVAPQRITDANVEKKAALLLEQYRKKAMLFRQNSVLVPLGDDFRFDKLQEWDYQMDNYQKLFDYMNSRGDWNVEAKFATLTDYFESIVDKSVYPSLQGDFFTYADRDDHYWSGYFTSRPFYKRYDRVLESYLRSAEISLSLASILSSKPSIFQQEYEMLSFSRKNLALFQHHDGITGTAKDFVVNDYADRMHKSMLRTQNVIAKTMASLVEMPDANFIFLDLFEDYNSEMKQRQIMISDNKPKWTLLVYNSLTTARNELLCLRLDINATNWLLKDSAGNEIPLQLSYVWSGVELNSKELEACFMTTLAQLSITLFKLERSTTAPAFGISQVKLYNFEHHISEELISNVETPSEIELQTKTLKLVFSGADGMLRRVIQFDGGLPIKTHEVRTQLMTYGTKSAKTEQKSGAYLFMPDTSEAQVINYGKPKIRVMKGKFYSVIEVMIERPIKLIHRITLVEGEKHFKVEHDFHLVKRTFSNKELIMRFYTGIQNEDIFYTDINGLQMMKRKKYLKIPLQGNVYPVSTLMYIEDDTTRLNILTGQPLGGTSYHPGFMDIFLDRLLIQDDSRGLGQGLIDNRRTIEVFKVYFEPKPYEPLKPSMRVQHELHKLLYPPLKMVSTSASNSKNLSFLSKELPCDVHLMNLRSNETMQKFHATFHKLSVSCETLCSDNSNSLKLSQFLSKEIVSALSSTMVQTSLSYMHELKNLNIGDEVPIETNDFATFALKLKESS